MGRKRGRSRSSSGRSGMMSSMRGGFRSAVKGVTGQKGTTTPPSPVKHLLMNLLTIGLVVAAAVFLLRRFGVLP